MNKLINIYNNWGDKNKIVIVKIKNKPNEIKAIKYLGKFAQHKPLFKEVVKTLDFLSEVTK